MEDLKKLAAQRALDLVEDGMAIGLGSGSTAAHFIDLLGAHMQAGGVRNLTAVATSEATARRANKLGIPLTTLTRLRHLDLVVDGADEIDPQLNLIKGLGRALLREKIIETHTACLVIIADESKYVARLGTNVPLPVEVVKFEVGLQIDWLNTLGCQANLLEEYGAPVVTDNGNYLAHCWFAGGIPAYEELAQRLAERPGIVEHGLFLGLAHIVILACHEGIQVLEREA